MKNENAYVTVALLLISRGAPLNSSFKLMQFIEWKLKVIDSSYILDKIRQENYAHFDIVNGVHYYFITTLGDKFVLDHFETALNFLIGEYPNEAAIIESLFHSYGEKR